MILSERVSGKVSVWGLITAIALVAVALPGWSLGPQQPDNASFERRAQAAATTAAAQTDDKQSAEAMSARLKQLEAEIERLRKILDARQSSESKSSDGVVSEGRVYRFSFDQAGPRVEAFNQDGRTLWQSRLPDSRVRSIEHELRVSKDGKQVTLYWGPANSRTAYTLDVNTGQLLRSLPVPPPTPQAPQNSEAEYQRAVAAVEVARKQYERLKISTDKVAKDELDAAKADWFAREKDKQALASQLTDALKAAIAARQIAQGIYERSVKLVDAGAMSKAELDAAQARFQAAAAEARRFELALKLNPQQVDGDRSAKNTEGILVERLQKDQVRADYERLLKLYKDKIVSQAAVDAARAQVQALEAQQSNLKSGAVSADKNNSPSFVAIKLKHANAVQVASAVQKLFLNRYTPEELPKHDISLSVDERTNGILVKASPSDLAEIRALVGRLDTSDTVVFAGAPDHLKGIRIGQTPANATSTSPLDLAERYLKAVADLKLARSRLARLPKAAGAVSKQEIEEAEIELERAQKQERLVAAFFADGVKSAQAARNAVRDEHRRLEQLYQQGAVSRAILDEARARLDTAETQVRQFESVQAIIQATSKTSSESRPQRP